MPELVHGVGGGGRVICELVDGEFTIFAKAALAFVGEI
jgi:hypothetical protein